ncbi:Phosphoglycerol transferase I [Nymphon striatum]|nr:Phosphoglycerol transferase I [Nymphon striatum]
MGSLHYDRQSDVLLKIYNEPEISIKEGQTPYNFIHGFSANKLLQAKDTGWTAAGIAAAQCGVPLSPFGILSFNHFGLTNEFLTNTTCLGDLLEERGYDLTSIQGADVSFAGQKNLFGKHGYKTVFGYHELAQLYPNRKQHGGNDGRNDWGYTDDTVFIAAMDALEKAQAKSNPFGIVLQTIGGHSPNGNFAPDCEGRPELQAVSISILKSNYCTNLLVKEFFERARDRGLLENTIVIVQSDHFPPNQKSARF